MRCETILQEPRALFPLWTKHRAQSLIQSSADFSLHQHSSSTLNHTDTPIARQTQVDTLQ